MSYCKTLVKRRVSNVRVF